MCYLSCKKEVGIGIYTNTCLDCTCQRKPGKVNQKPRWEWGGKKGKREEGSWDEQAVTLGEYMSLYSSDS